MRFGFAILASLLMVLAFGCRSEETYVAPTETMVPGTAADTTMQAAPPPTATAADTAAATATEGEQTPAAAAEPPKTHTVDHGGVMHAAGAKDNPTQKCGACHGRDLKGGKVAASSCFDCHEQMW